MPDDVATLYTFVDTAMGGVNRRNHVQRLADVNFADQGAERYISHRRGPQDLMEWVRNHTNASGQPTIEGYDGPVWDTSLPFDFDDRTDPANALAWVRQFLQRLALHDVSLDALRVYFSGAKGFHVEIPHTLFGGFEPSEELHTYERRAAVELMGSIPFDHSVYDKLRLWRLPNSLNAKGNRYKVRLSLEEVLNLDMPAILALAEHPRPRLATAPDSEWEPNEYLVEVWARARGTVLPGNTVARAAVEAALNAATWSDTRSNAVFTAAAAAAIAQSWPSDAGVSRHTDFLLPLSGFLTRQLGAEAAADLLKTAARMAGDSTFLEDRTRHWEAEVDRLCEGSAEKIARDQPVEGLPTISKRWPELADFLGTYFITRTDPANPANPAKQKGFSFTSLADALDEPPEQIANLVEDMLPMGGVSITGAKPKVGKSVFVRNLAMSVARGEPFLGRACQQGAVLILALEEKRPEVINHFRMMGGMDESIHLHTGAAPSSSKEGLAALTAAIAVYQPVLVIIDPIFKLVRVRDSSDYAELTRELEPVLELARRTNCHIALTHHLGKMIREGGDDVLGSTAIFGAVDTLILMRRLKDNQRTVETIQRYGKDLVDTAIPLDEVTGLINLGAPVSELKITECKAKVLEALGRFTADYWPDTGKLRETAEVDKRLIVRVLKDLVDAGNIWIRGSGKRGDPYRFHLPIPSSNSSEKFPDAGFLTSMVNPESRNETEAEIGAEDTPGRAEKGAAESLSDFLDSGFLSNTAIQHPETDPVCKACGKPLSEGEQKAGFGLHMFCTLPIDGSAA